MHEEFAYLLSNSKESQKIRIRTLHEEFASISVKEFNIKYMKLTKFGFLMNKTTYLLPSRRCGKILEILDGRGVNFGGLLIQTGGGTYGKSLPCSLVILREQKTEP